MSRSRVYSLPFFVLLSALLTVVTALMVQRIVLDREVFHEGLMQFAPPFPALKVAGASVSRWLFLVSVLYLGVLYVLARVEVARSRKKALKTAVLVAILAQASCYFWVGPIHSQDMYYYAGQGRLVSVQGQNPYAHTLSEFAEKDPVIGAIPGPWMKHSAFYGPSSMAIFALAVQFGGDTLQSCMPPMKVVMALAYLFLLAAAWRLFKVDGGPLWLTRFYALCGSPPVLWFLVLDGHLDGMLMLFFALAYVCFMKERWTWGALYVAAAASFKITGAAVMPALACYMWITLPENERWKKILAALGAFSLASLVVRLPFGGAELRHLAQMGDMMTSDQTMGVFNMSLLALLEGLGLNVGFSSEAEIVNFSSLLCMVAFLLSAIWMYTNYLVKKPSSFYSLMLLISCTFLFFLFSRKYMMLWYLLWAFPSLFLCLRSVKDLMLASLFIVLPLAAGVRLGVANANLVLVSMILIGVCYRFVSVPISVSLED